MALDSYKGQVILKDKFLFQCASDIRIKLQQFQQLASAASLDEMVQTAKIYFITENKRGGQDPGKREKERDKACLMLAALQGSPMANPESLKDKAEAKCLICRQAGHWAKECPNHDKSPKATCYKCLQWDTGQHSALGTQRPQNQVPSLHSWWFNRTEVACSSQPTCYR